MITVDYVRTMARYNAWQNTRMTDALAQVSAVDLSRDRGLFFGSLLATANHVLWGDLMWISRFGRDIPVPQCTPGGTDMYTSFDDWHAKRTAVDGEIQGWAKGVAQDVLDSELVWTSGLTGQELRKPMALCVMHLFTHQTHHRGQIHAGLTTLGIDPGVTDLVFLPE